MSEHNHDFGEEQDDDRDLIITMTDEEGNEIDMIVVETLNVDEQLYAILLQRDDQESDGIVVRLEEQDEEIGILPIDDDGEWERVQQAYNELIADRTE